mmetsp:Transcript_50391/g.119856  ORF Transcript_50391/g.119856 Transcript_50391/m.119856 type:complete len:274 (-) Transcript_50391:162-983(-)
MRGEVGARWGLDEARRLKLSASEAGEGAPLDSRSSRHCSSYSPTVPSKLYSPSRIHAPMLMRERRRASRQSATWFSPTNSSASRHAFHQSTASGKTVRPARRSCRRRSAHTPEGGAGSPAWEETHCSLQYTSMHDSEPAILNATAHPHSSTGACFANSMPILPSTSATSLHASATLAARMASIRAPCAASALRIPSSCSATRDSKGDDPAASASWRTPTRYIRSISASKSPSASAPATATAPPCWGGASSGALMVMLPDAHRAAREVARRSWR